MAVQPVKAPPRRNAPPKNVKPMYRCTCCGKEWKDGNVHFYRSFSIFYEGNNGFITECKDCIDKEYVFLVNVFEGNDIEALKHMCQRYDWYFDEHTAETIVVNGEQTKIQAYILAKRKWSQKKKDSSFADYIREVQSRRTEYVEDDEPKVTQEMIKRWSNAWSPREMCILEEHYKLLHRCNPNVTGNQETYIKDLCYSNLLKLKALQDKDVDTATKVMASYQKTFSSSGLKLEEEQDESEKQTLGLTLQLMSQYTPEEYYKDKTLFRDYSGIDEYLQRHIARPIMNIVAGTKDRDPVYHVYGDAEGEEAGDVE